MLINLSFICSSHVCMICRTFGLSFSLGLWMDSVKKEEGASPNMKTPLTGFWMVEEEKKEEIEKGEKDEG